MSTASAFLEQSAFPPLNPQSAAAKLSYHFMADFFCAIICRGGFPLFYALKVPMVMFAFALGSLTCYFFDLVLKQRVAAVSASILFFFGHIGVFNFLYGAAGYPVANGPLSLRSWESIEDHLTYPYFNYLNVLVDFFEPQLPFLFGFPIALAVLLVLFRKFSRPEPFDQGNYFIIGAVALLPLFHMHSFLVLAPVTGLWLISEWWLDRRATATSSATETPSRYGRRSVWLAALLLAGAAVVLQLAFILSQKKAAGFSGFDVFTRLGNLPEIPNFLYARRLWYWVRVAGIPFVLGLVGFFLTPSFQVRAQDPERRANLALLALFGVTTGYFLLINFYRFTPNWGDSNKFFLYWDVMLCLYAGRVLSRLWAASRLLKAAACFLLLIGAIFPFADECSLRYRHSPSTLFTACDQTVGDWIRLNTPKDAVFLTANSYTHLVPAIAGRRVVNGSYTRETGFSDEAIESSVALAFREANPALVKSVKVTHVLVGPEEKRLYYVNRAAMTQWHKVLYDQTCEGQRYLVCEVQDVSPEQLEAERNKGEIRGFVWLSEQQPSFVTQFGTLEYDESFDMTPLKLNGKVYTSGLGTHAPSEIRFDLNGKYRVFEADVGVDDLQTGSSGSVVFRVLVDDKEMFASAVMRPGQPHEHVSVDLTGANRLTLIVGDAGDGNHNDHADWADAKLIIRP
jgi:NPCBM/NEW2 domain